MTEDSKVLAVLAETPLAGLINALKTGEFQPSPSEPAAPDDTIIGELTDTEKAIYSALELLDVQAKKIAETNNALVDEAIEKGEEIDKLQVFLNRAEFEATKKMLDGLRALMWHSIKKRVGSSLLESGSGSIGIRNGYVLVSFSPQMEDACEMIFELLMNGRGGRV